MHQPLPLGHAVTLTAVVTPTNDNVRSVSRGAFGVGVVLTQHHIWPSGLLLLGGWPVLKS